MNANKQKTIQNIKRFCIEHCTEYFTIKDIKGDMPYSIVYRRVKDLQRTNKIQRVNHTIYMYIPDINENIDIADIIADDYFYFMKAKYHKESRLWDDYKRVIVIVFSLLCVGIVFSIV